MDTNQVYGFSPVLKALPIIKTINIIKSKL